MRFIYAIFAVFVAVFTNAQTTNYALAFDGGSSVETANVVSELNSTTEFTFQSWMYIDKWKKGSSLFLIQKDKKSSLSIELGDFNNLLVSIVKGKKYHVTIPTIKQNEWQHITIVYNGSTEQKLKVYLNNNEVGVKGSQKLPSSLPILDSKIVLGNGFSGRLDETRLFTKAIAENDFSIKNTLNHYHPNWNELLLYYKYDQNQCPDIYDYTQKNHSFILNAKREIVEDNPLFIYRKVSGYTNFSRFFDRPNINSEMYLMTNDILFLSFKAMNNGTISVEAEDNSGTILNANHLKEFKGHNGVMSFNGLGSLMDIGYNAAVHKTNQEVNGLTLQGWIYIEEWNEGSYLFKKEQDKDTRFNVKFGKDNYIDVECNNYTWSFESSLTTNNWHYISVRFNSNNDPNKQFDISVDGNFIMAKQFPASSVVASIPLMNGTKSYLAVDFNGKLDDFILYRTARNDIEIIAAINGERPTIPAIGNDINPRMMFDINAYWNFDNSNDPALDVYSFKSFCSIIREVYSGYRGYKFKLGLIAEDGWENHIGTPGYNEGVVAGLERSIQFFDGIDMDYEWCYENEECWSKYSALMKQVSALCKKYNKEFTITPHPVSYKMAKEDLDIPDAVLFQNYGPSPVRYGWEDYEKSANDFLNWGYDPSKISMGIPTIVAKRGDRPIGYVSIVNSCNITASDNTAMFKGGEWTFNGVNLVKEKCRLVVEKNMGGIMYFDMGNDAPTTNPLSLIRAINDVINSNVDIEINSTVISRETIY